MYAEKELVAAPDDVDTGFSKVKRRLLDLIAVREVDHAGQGSRSASDIEQLINCQDRPISCVIEALSPQSDFASCQGGG